jgi:glycine dehydrogenase
LTQLGLNIEHQDYFDTITVNTAGRSAHYIEVAKSKCINLRPINAQSLSISLDETTQRGDLLDLLSIFAEGEVTFNIDALEAQAADALPASLIRESAFLSHPVFNRYHSETEMMRYLRKLADKDLALDRAMIPLGSCTMKLNATTEMQPITWAEFSGIHPFVPREQVQGYKALCDQLEEMLCACTGYAAVSLQPNAGSQGEYAGLLAIKAYHESRGEGDRNICLIPSSAHGTNPASAAMVGMKVTVVACDQNGNIDLEDLKEKAEKHSKNLAAIMITYPSTHGVFEEAVREVCDIVHQHGGQVYLDGANLNAMVGLCAPGEFGGDVSHLNLHKTFAIPHGGGGPGVGPIGVREHLKPFLPGHSLEAPDSGNVGPVSAAPWGSAGILPITYGYIALLGREGLTQATKIAILNANYIAAALAPHFPVLYSGSKGMVAHECILDLRPLKDATGITVDDVAKRLIDFGFHAPTMSFPVPGTLMIEPTESESKVELDRFINAMVAIRAEIESVAKGEMDAEDNPLRNAPHTADDLITAEWSHPYSREQAIYPTAELRSFKYWAPVGRIDNIYGDRQLVCTCPDISEYEEPKEANKSAAA